MFLKFQLIIYSLIFLFGLESIIFKPKFVFLAMVFLFLLSLYEGRKIGGKWLYTILPVFFTISSVALLYLVTISYEQQVLIAIASLMYYFSLLSAYRLGKYENDQTARGMNMAAAIATIFFTYASAYGLYLNFLVPLYYLMLAYLITTALISYQYFSIIQGNQKRVAWIYSLILALIMAEIIWTMNFWPFGYLTTGVIALILYYVLWDLTQSYFLNLLSRKRVVANMVFFSVMVMVVLLSAKWIPVI